MKFKTLFLVILSSLNIAVSIAQSAKEAAMKQLIDSIKLAAISDYATRYPVLRQGSFAVDVIGSRKVKGELNGSDLFEGKTDITRIRSNFNIPLAQFGKNVVTGTIAYQQIHFNLNQVNSSQATFGSESRSVSRETVGFAASFRRSDSLFNRPISYGGTISGMTNEFSSIKRMNYLGNIIYSLSRTASTSWSVGFAVIIDPSSVAPLVPIVSYWHHYKNPGLDLYVDLPSRVTLRKQLSKKSWAFIGSELGGNIYFFDLKQPTLPQNTIYSTVDLRTGATLEYLLTKKLVIGISGGMYTLAKSSMFEHNAKTSDYFFKTNNGTMPYVTVGMSLLPFLKSWK